VSDTTTRRIAGAAFFLLALVAELLRIHHADALYAEDRKNFLADWVNRPATSVLFSPYDGYQHFVPRLLSGMVVATVPVAHWGTAVAVLSCITVAAICTLVLALSRDFVVFGPARLFLALIPILTPLTGLEAVGNVNNLHWYMSYLMLWVLLARPQSTAGRWLLALLATVAVLSEVQCLIFAPLVGWLAVKERRWGSDGPGRINALSGWVAGAVVQVTTYLVDRGRDRGGEFDSLWRGLKGYLVEAIGTSLYPTGRKLVPVVVSFGFAFVAIVGLGLCAAGIAAWRHGNRNIRAAVATAGFVSLTSWLASYYINEHDNYNAAFANPFDHSVPAVRWGTAAAMLMLTILPLSIEVLVRRMPRLRRLGAGLVLVLSVGLLATSAAGRLQVDRHRPWSEAVVEATQECGANAVGYVNIPINPRYWVVAMPCSRLVP